MGIKNFISSLCRDERGQSTTEYILILSVVVMIAMKFKEKFGSTLLTILGTVSSDMEKAAAQGN